MQAKPQTSEQREWCERSLYGVTQGGVVVDYRHDSASGLGAFLILEMAPGDYEECYKLYPLSIRERTPRILRPGILT